MKLKKLTLKNYRSFDDFTIDFDENLTVIVAENGVGKTSVLDAVTVALGQFIGGFDTGKDSGFSANDAKLSIVKSQTTQTINMESIYPVTLIAEGEVDRQEEEWSRVLNGKKSKTTYGKATILKEYAKRLQEQVREGIEVSLPIVSYYGTGRLWHQKQTSKENSTNYSRLFGYDKALEPASTYKEFARWFEDESRAEHNNLVKIFQKKGTIDFSLLEKSIALDNIRETLDICLSISEWRDIRYDYDFKKITVTHPKQGVIPIARLSDGVRSMLAMTADIAYRCTKLNPHLPNAPKETKGIVLIDEVDLHLHPKWQQVVIPNLREAFPKIQFIVTTHSPQVLTTVSKQHIRVITSDEAVEPKISPLARESADALAYVMNTNVKPPLDILEQIHTYEQLVKKGEIESLKAKNIKQIFDNIGYEIPQQDLELWIFLAEQQNG